MSENRTITINEGGEEKVMTIKDIKFDFMDDYCAEHGEYDWWENLVNSDVKVHKDKKDPNSELVDAPISFLEVRNAFLNKFFPELVKEKKKKPLSMREKVALRKAQMGK